MKLDQLSDLFEQAILIENGLEQSLFVESSCSSLEDRKKLMNLVRAHGQTCSIVDQQDLVGEISKSIAPNDSTSGEGAIVGNYRLLQSIGEGGMGRVFMADQLKPIKRRVAVKIFVTVHGIKISSD